LLVLGKVTSGVFAFRNRIGLSGAIPHPLDAALEFLKQNSDVAVQRAALYQISQAAALSLSTRQLKDMLAILRRHANTIPSRAWGLVGALRRMVIVTRDQTQAHASVSSGIAMQDRGINGSPVRAIGEEAAEVSQPIHGTHLAPRSYFVLDRDGSGLRAISCVRFSLKPEFFRELQHNLKLQERLGEDPMADGAGNKHRSAQRSSSEHVPNYRSRRLQGPDAMGR